jgi:hypothetical protein
MAWRRGFRQLTMSELRRFLPILLAFAIGLAVFILGVAAGGVWRWVVVNTALTIMFVGVWRWKTIHTNLYVLRETEHPLLFQVVYWIVLVAAYSVFNVGMWLAN